MGGGTEKTISYPIAFSGKPYALVTGKLQYITGTGQAVVKDYSASSVTLLSDTNGSIWFMAVGY